MGNIGDGKISQGPTQGLTRHYDLALQGDILSSSWMGGFTLHYPFFGLICSEV